MSLLTRPLIYKKSKELEEKYKEFAVKKLNASSIIQFCNNPFMFKVTKINGDSIDTTSSASSVLGQACHYAISVFLGGAEDIILPADNPAECKKISLDAGLSFLENNYPDGFINYNKTIPNRGVLIEKYTYSFMTYLKENDLYSMFDNTLMVEEKLEHKVAINDEEKPLPLPLSGRVDLVYKEKNKIIIRDHKFVFRWDGDSINGARLIQAAVYYCLVAAETGEKPYAIEFAEFKTTPNRDKKEKQTKIFRIVYEEHPIIFQFFLRLYSDIIRGISGEQVYLPNLNDFYDGDISLIAYIEGLDLEKTQEQKFKESGVTNISDFLQKTIINSKNMSVFEQTIKERFVSGASVTYKTMTIENRIKMKLAEHGIAVDFHELVKGGSVDLYLFEPSVGVKMKKVESFAKDIELVTETQGVRILAPFPNTGFIGFEVPSRERKFYTKMPKFDNYNVVFGIDVYGKEMRMDIRETPHLLVAGATGSGKSKFTEALLKQLFQNNCEVILCDPKMVDLYEFKSHKNVTGYFTNLLDIAEVTDRLVVEMDARFELMQSRKIRNITGEKDIKPIFCFIDEFGDLVSRGFKSNFKKNILILAQKARASGIHIVLATQRPSATIIDGDIKANFPSRVALRTSSLTDSRIIIDTSGAEKLLGKGDLLFMTPQHGIVRLQGLSL